MANREPKYVKLMVDDEEALYAGFSPEDEFDESVKAYVRSKVADKGRHQGINMTVVSEKPLDENRFRTAVSNWVRDERSLFKRTEKETLIALFGSLAFGSAMIVLSVILGQQYTGLEYSLIPIMGSLALAKAADIMIVTLPINSANKKLLGEMENTSTITFLCDCDRHEAAVLPE